MTPAIPDLHPYLTAAYSGDELATLCADYFRDVYENFAAGMTKAQKILLLLDYCQRRELLLNLVAALERDRPEQYQRHFGADGGDRPTRTRPQRSPRQVFVSDAHQDAEFAHRLAADLQQRGWQAWIAPASIRPGEKWVEAINRGLAESSVFVVVLTPAAVDSPWVTDETNAAIMLTNKGKLRFIPAEVASCDAPPLWELYQWIPFTVRYADGLSALLATLGQGAVAPPRTPDPVRAGVPHPVAMPSLEPGRGDPAPTAAPPRVPDPMPPVLPEITDYQTDHVGARSPRPASMLGYKQILCPNCLTEIRYRNEVSKCANPKCAKELPVQYIQNYERAAPFFVQLIGWSAVGKTVYLQALTLMLMQMGKIWRNYSFSPLTEQTLGYVQGVREFLSKGTMPPPTQLALQEACIMLLLGMSRWDGRMLVSRDVAGEVFNKLQFPIEYTPYLLHVPTTFLMISLYDLEEFPEKSMDQLMTSFIETMGKYDPNFHKKQRKLVVVLSKADKIFGKLPLSLREYLRTDPFPEALNSRQPVQPFSTSDMQRYMENLARVSREIQDWITESPPGKNLIMQARNNNIHLEFTIVSSTGFDVDSRNNRLETIMRPHRVLDPFFWALNFQSEP